MSGPLGRKFEMKHPPGPDENSGKRYDRRYQAVTGPQGIIVDARKWAEVNCALPTKHAKVRSDRSAKDIHFAVGKKARWLSSQDPGWIRFAEEFSMPGLDLNDVDLGRLLYPATERFTIGGPNSRQPPRCRRVLGKRGR